MEKENNKFESNAFIMCPKAIIYEYDITTACLYGLIWSFSQMILGKCTLSQPQMAKKLDLSVGTINKKIRKLKKAGLIEIVVNRRYPNGGVSMHIKTVPYKLELLEEKYKGRLNGEEEYDDDES